jgi:sigma-B regulation protein RsbU (phosphoserine phosphatase)
VLIPAAGEVEVLGSTPERLLGADASSPRSNHEVLLHPNDTVVFYTDGIVDAWSTGIDEGIARLTGALGKMRNLRLEDLCDQMLGRVVGGSTDDDIAILAVRCHSEDDPVPEKN